MKSAVKDPVRHFCEIRLADGVQSAAATSTCGGTGSSTSTRRPIGSTRSSTTCWSAVRTGCRRLPPEMAHTTGHPVRARPTRVRRACLFAGYDPDGIVDDYVVDYVTELSRHADVYYLADSTMAPQELAKLSR